MFDSFIAYYHENTVDSYIDYRTRRSERKAGRSGDLRSALAAANALFHVREHLPADLALSRAQVESMCPAYAVLGDITNASKHAKIQNNTPHGAPIVDQASRLTELITQIRYKDGDGHYWFTHKEVIAQATTGETIVLARVLTDVINFWEDYLHQKGLLPETRQFQMDAEHRFRSREESADTSINFEVVRGQRFQQNLQLLEFDEVSGKVVPMIIQPDSVKMRIYRPALSVDINLTSSKGEVYKVEVDLTAEESTAVMNVDAEEEKQALLPTLESVKAAISKFQADFVAGKIAPKEGDETR